jgi:hypothetical protein
MAGVVTRILARITLAAVSDPRAEMFDVLGTRVPLEGFMGLLQY